MTSRHPQIEYGIFCGANERCYQSSTHMHVKNVLRDTRRTRIDQEQMVEKPAFCNVCTKM